MRISVEQVDRRGRKARKDGRRVEEIREERKGGGEGRNCSLYVTTAAHTNITMSIIMSTTSTKTNTDTTTAITTTHAYETI